MKLIDASRLLWVTPEAERLIVKTARVSAPQNEDNLATGPRLLKYLIKHKHWSPFEMANMCLEIYTQRDISAQIIRHRSFHFQEFSQRYAETEQAKIPKFRRQDSRNRQNSIDDLNDEQIDMLEELTYKYIKEGYELYQTMLEMGVAKETARRHLPMCSPTRIYMNGTLRDWIHYINLRTDKGTQWEHRTIANQAKIIFEQQFPVISEAVWYET
tara:strand:- start:130 stop:771 length:642 start_codon:yes stop_codon:yes gene_type:complete